MLVTSAMPVSHDLIAADQLEANRSAVVDFLTMASRGQAREAIERYATPDFVHHNPYFASDARSLATAMDDNARANPEKTLQVLRTVGEGPLLVVHSRVQHRPSDSPASVVHIFRFEDGRMAELWDIGQEIPADSPNTAGPF
jgi:predicted SnoaL-like aldol condensation-catalyzing enzyme